MKKVSFCCFILLSYCLNLFAQIFPPGTSIEISSNQTYNAVYYLPIDTSYRELDYEHNHYKIMYVYDGNFSMMPAVAGYSQPHYYAKITVYKLDSGYEYLYLLCSYDLIKVNNKVQIRCPTYKQIGKEMSGMYVQNGCFEDIPENWIIEAIKNTHRKYELGMTFDTYPPVYLCRYCFKEYSPYNYCKTYEDVGKIYEKYGERGGDSFFIAKWNEVDTSCLSSEIEMHKTQDIWQNWKNTHKKGSYWIDKNSKMVLFNDGTTFMYYFDNGKFIMGMGGRYNDSTLLADKWYKVVYENKKK